MFYITQLTDKCFDALHNLSHIAKSQSVKLNILEIQDQESKMKS